MAKATLSSSSRWGLPACKLEAICCCGLVRLFCLLLSGLVHATSKTSGMSLFHHILRRPSKDDEQVLELLKCIYEDKPLRERVSLPSLYALKCDKGQTLAFYAAAYGHAKCLKWILEQIGACAACMYACIKCMDACEIIV